MGDSKSYGVVNHHRGPRVWQVAVWRGRLRRLIAAGWQALITLRWRLLRRWRMIDPRCQGPRDAAHSWRTTARAPRRRHRCTRLVDLANARCFAPTLADTLVSQSHDIIRLVVVRVVGERSRRPCRLRFSLITPAARERDASFSCSLLSHAAETAALLTRPIERCAFCALPRYFVYRSREIRLQFWSVHRRRGCRERVARYSRWSCQTRTT